MDDNNGWICLHRRLIEHELWTQEKFTRGQAWVDLLLLANHAPGSFRVRGVEVKVCRGQVGWSEVTLSHRWKWSRDKVRRYLKELEKLKNIIQHKDNVTSLITIINYEAYQEIKTANKTPKKQQKDTNNNEDNEKKESMGKFSPPTIEEVTAYCLERGRGIDPEKWMNHYQAKGWMIGKNKMKDWKAAVCTWEKPPPPPTAIDMTQPGTASLTAEQIQATIGSRYAV